MKKKNTGSIESNQGHRAKANAFPHDHTALLARGRVAEHQRTIRAAGLAVRIRQLTWAVDGSIRLLRASVKVAFSQSNAVVLPCILIVAKRCVMTADECDACAVDVRQLQCAAVVAQALPSRAHEGRLLKHTAQQRTFTWLPTRSNTGAQPPHITCPQNLSNKDSQPHACN